MKSGPKHILFVASKVTRSSDIITKNEGKKNRTKHQRVTVPSKY